MSITWCTWYRYWYWPLTESQNLMSGSPRLLGGISTNLFLSVSTVTVPTWHVEHVSSEHYCQTGIFCSWYTRIVEPLQSLQEQPTWLWWSSLMNALPPEMMIITGHDTDIYIEWHNWGKPVEWLHCAYGCVCLLACLLGLTTYMYHKN